jgi:anaerobic ribonucleoside-triphosphate reductase activating protein
MQPVIPVEVYSVPVLQDKIARAVIDYNIEGITFLGGEPIIQAMGLAELAAFARLKGLSVIVFTGFTMEQLKTDNLPGVNTLLGFCDVVIDGCFLQGNPDLKRNWVGSTNQNFHYLTHRYNQEIETNKKYRSSIEVRISTDKIQGNGCPYALDSILHQTDET